MTAIAPPLRQRRASPPLAASRLAPVTAVALDLSACQRGECEHYHPIPVDDDPQRRAERRVRECLEDLRVAIRCLPVAHFLRREFEAGELYAPWRLRADALLHRIDRERRARRRLHRTLRSWR